MKSTKDLKELDAKVNAETRAANNMAVHAQAAPNGRTGEQMQQAAGNECQEEEKKQVEQLGCDSAQDSSSEADPGEEGHVRFSAADRSPIEKLGDASRYIFKLRKL